MVTNAIGQIVTEAALESLAAVREEERQRTAAEAEEIAEMAARKTAASRAAAEAVARYTGQKGLESVRERAGKPTPPVSSAPRGSSTRLILLSLGAMALLLLAGPPLVSRWTRARGIGEPVSLESSPRVAPRPRFNQATAQLIDVVRASNNSLLPYAIDKQKTSIGRDSSNDIVIVQDSVSSFHATIDYKNGYFYVEDHRSTNGTYLEGERLRNNKPVQLKSGDRIDFAVFEFRFIIPDHEPRGRTAVLNVSPVGVSGGTNSPSCGARARYA